MNFANRLKALRIEKNLRQDDLAKILNISRQSVSNYENGARFPKDEMLLHNISSFFNVSLDYLLGATNIRCDFSYKGHNVLLEEKENSYSCDKKAALEELFGVIDNLPINLIVTITKAIKLFIDDEIIEN